MRLLGHVAATGERLLLEIIGPRPPDAEEIAIQVFQVVLSGPHKVRAVRRRH
jgi:hypothetical protein